MEYTPHGRRMPLRRCRRRGTCTACCVAAARAPGYHVAAAPTLSQRWQVPVPAMRDHLRAMAETVFATIIRGALPCCAIGSWGGRRRSRGGEVTVTGATGGAAATAGCACC